MQLSPMTLKLLGASLIIHAVDVFSSLKQITLQYLFICVAKMNKTCVVIT